MFPLPSMPCYWSMVHIHYVAALQLSIRVTWPYTTTSVWGDGVWGENTCHLSPSSCLVASTVRSANNHSSRPCIVTHTHNYVCTQQRSAQETVSSTEWPVYRSRTYVLFHMASCCGGDLPTYCVQVRLHALYGASNMAVGEVMHTWRWPDENYNI